MEPWGAWPANPPGLSKGMMSSKLRRHNMTRDMTFNIPCSAGADSRFQKMVSMMDTCRAGGACVSSSMIWLVLYCIGSIIARARSSHSPADLQQTEAKLSAEDMSENRRYAPACQCAIGGICHGLMPRARIPIASLMCCRNNAGERCSESCTCSKVRQRSCQRAGYEALFAGAWGEVWGGAGRGMGQGPSGATPAWQLVSPWAIPLLDPL